MPRIEPGADDVERPGTVIFDEDFLPLVLGLIVLVKPLYDDILLRLAVWAEHVFDGQVAADDAEVFRLGNRVAAQNGWVCQRDAAQFVEPGVRDHGVGNAVLQGLCASFGAEMPKGETNLFDNGRQHPENRHARQGPICWGDEGDASGNLL